MWKLFDNENRLLDFKYEDILVNKNNKTKNYFSEIHQIKFVLESPILIFINEKNKLQKDPDKFNIKKIIKIEILNNFIGEVSSISFISKIKSKNTIEYIIKKIMR